MNQKYFWQGEPIKTDFGYSVVKENTDKPLYWYNFECNWNSDLNKKKYGTSKTALIASIKITTKDDYIFYIANHFGIGANKLSKGGWPNATHFSIPDDAKFEGTDNLGCLRNIFSIRKFDEDGFCKHEALRKQWQKDNFPIEFERSEKIKESFRLIKR